LLEVNLGVHLKNEKVKMKYRVEETQASLLVIDGEAQVREVVSKALKGDPCQVVFEESTLRDGNMLLENSQFDIVLIDL
jgi:CheY-like chemotaxis protein